MLKKVLKSNESPLILVFIISGISLIGWLFGKFAYAAFSLLYIPIAPSTALIFMLLCILFVSSRIFQKSPIAQMVNTTVLTLVVLFCLVILLDYLFNFKWDVETVFIKNPGKFGEVPTGRMSHITAVLFISTCIGIWGIKPANSSVIKYITGGFSLAVCLVSSLLLIGYIYDAPLLYGSLVIPVALPTALCFLLFSMTLLLKHGVQFWSFGLIRENIITRQLLNWFLPVVIVIVLSQGYLITNFSTLIKDQVLPATLILLVMITITIIAVVRVSSILGTRLLNAERTLRISEYEFRLLAESMPQIVWVTRPDGWTTYFNQHWVNYTGLSLEESYGHGWNKPFHPDDQQRSWDAWQNATKNKTTYSLECRLRRHDGVYKWWLIRGVPVFDDQGIVLKWFGTCTDIDDMKQAEVARQKAHKLLVNLSEQVPGVIYQYRLFPDGTSCFPYASSGMNEIYEVTPEEVREDASPVFTRIHPDDYDYIVETITESARNQTAYQSEFRVVLPRQGLCWRHCDAKPELLEDGSTLWHGTISDITARKKAEQELFEAKEKAEESDRLKSAFLANMSHEIRTPMNGILGFAQLLKEPNLTGDEQQEYIRIIEKSGARMLNIIHNIVDISKIESGQMEVSVSETNINEQIKFIYDFFIPEVEQKGCRIFYKNTLSNDEAVIKTDREKIYAILTNLVKNAVKNTSEGYVELGYEKKGEFLEFFVRDTGAGIPHDRQEAIFERFIQADITDKQASQGAGLGLAITKAYVEMLGGRIWVESEYGKGAAFYFTTPYNFEAEEKITGNEMTAEGNKGEPVKKLRILIAEDDEASDEFITRLLTKDHHVILHAATGTEAVEMCRNDSGIDLVLMDIRMPGMNGYEASREIRRFNQDVIIIAQTAHALTGDREKALESGCNDYITKPIKSDTLLELLQKYFLV